MKKKNVVVIGGGTGTFTVLSGLKNYPLHLSAIVTMADDGGSTGVLRDELGVLPPGDVRRSLVALSDSSKLLRDLFNYRFENQSLRGHSFGNLFLTALEKVSGKFATAVQEAERILKIRGRVIPVTLDNVRLIARLKDGTVITGETNIDIPKHASRAPIEKVWLTPQAKVNPAAAQAIREADLIVIGPGDLYTSLIPNLLVRGMPEAIRKSRAKKLYVANLVNKFGETHGFRAEDFVRTMEQYLGKDIFDIVVFNRARPSPRVIARYRKEKAEFVAPPERVRKSDPQYVVADLIGRGKLFRHDPDRLAELIFGIVWQEA